MWSFSLYNNYAKVSFGTYIDRREFHTTAVDFGPR